MRPFPSPSCFVRTQANLNINVCTSHSDCLRCSDFGKRNQKNSGTGNSVQCAWNNARFIHHYRFLTNGKNRCRVNLYLWLRVDPEYPSTSESSVSDDSSFHPFAIYFCIHDSRQSGSHASACYIFGLSRIDPSQIERMNFQLNFKLERNDPASYVTRLVMREAKLFGQ